MAGPDDIRLAGSTPAYAVHCVADVAGCFRPGPTCRVDPPQNAARRFLGRQ